MGKSHLTVVSPTTENGTVTKNRPPKRRRNAEVRAREYLTNAEVEQLIKAAGDNRHGHRDATMILLAYRHGLRVSELVGLGGSRSTLRMGGFISTAPRTVRLVCTLYRVVRCAPCAGCDVISGRNRPSSSHPSGARHSPQLAFARCWRVLAAKRLRGLAPWLSSVSPCIRICSGTDVAFSWPTKASIRGRYSRTSATKTSNTPCVTPSFRRTGSRTSGTPKS